MSYRTFPLWQRESLRIPAQSSPGPAHPFGLVPKSPLGLKNFLPLPRDAGVLGALTDRNSIAWLGICLFALPSPRAPLVLGRVWGAGRRLERDRFVYVTGNQSLTLPKFQECRLGALGSVNMAVQGCTACTTASQTPDWGIQAVTKGGKNPEQAQGGK